MKPPFDKILSWVIMICIFQLSANPSLVGQTGEGMLIFQVDGNRYMRKNFNKANELQTYQTIEVGKATRTDGKIETKMTATTYNKDGILKGATQTTLVCTPDSRQILVGAFPFAGKKAKTLLVIKMEDDGIVYPKGWGKMENLKDFNFSLKFKEGAVGFFGTKSSISFTDRKVVPLNKNSQINGRITIKSYVLGIKVSTINYNYYEEIDIEKGIIRQNFTKDDGAYFTLELIE